MADYDITGIDGSFRAPGTYVEVLLGSGPSTAGGPGRRAVLVGVMTGTGYTAGTLYEVDRLSDVQTAAGAGSPLAIGVEKFLAANRSTRLSVLPIAETTGGSAAPATGTVVLATNAASNGTLSVVIDSQVITLAVSTGDTPTDIGDDLEAAVNGRANLPVTASNSSGTVTLTAKWNGLSGGTAADTHIPVSATITAGIGTTVAVNAIGSVQAGAEGTTTEAAAIATALEALEADERYYIGLLTPATDDSDVAWDNIAAHITANALPVAGKRTAGFVGTRGSLTDAATMAVAQNYERMHVIAHAGSPHGVPAIVGSVLGTWSLRESANVSVNLRDQQLLLEPAPSASRPTPTQINDALTDGVTVIGSTDSATHIVAAVTTKSKTSGVDDFRALPSTKRSVADAFAADLQAAWSVAFAGYNIANDITRRDGSVDTTQGPPDGVVTPRTATGWLRDWIRSWHEAAGRRHLQDFEANLADTQVARHSTVANRLAASVPIEAVDPLWQTTFRIEEQSAG